MHLRMDGGTKCMFTHRGFVDTLSFRCIEILLVLVCVGP